jgi:hypothetical protein
LPVYKPAVAKPTPSVRASAPELGSFLHNSQQHHQLFTPNFKAAAGADTASTPPVAAPKLSSHRITISPIERNVQSPDSLSAAADTVRQDNADTPRKAGAAAGVPSFSELLAKQQQADATADAATATPQLAGTTTDISTGADVAARYAGTAEGKSSAHKKAAHSKVPAGNSANRAQAMKTPPSSRKTSSAGGTAQTPPTYNHHTPRSMGLGASPSPSVARPTCASMSRAQAVAASMPTTAGAGGHWKL